MQAGQGGRSGQVKADKPDRQGRQAGRQSAHPPAHLSVCLPACLPAWQHAPLAVQLPVRRCPCMRANNAVKTAGLLRAAAAR